MCASLDLQLLRFKLASIRKELDDTAPLFRVLASKEPDAIEIRAAGSILQSIYNGIEAVLLRHAYGFMLDWALMREMFLGLPELAAAFEAAIEEHVKTI